MNQRQARKQNHQQDLVSAAARRMVLGTMLAGAGLVLSACSGGSGGSAGTAQAVRFAGKTLGGQQPVVGATVTLYAAGTGGYGVGTPELGHGTTGSGGAWGITLASCPAGDPQLYLVATGGKSDASATSDNSAAVMSAALGPCSTANGSTHININEVSTVAAAYALSGFLDDSGRQLGTSATNAAGLNNAAASAAILADTNTGLARISFPDGSSGTLPAATLNTLANILAACVNSTGASSASCASLLGSGGASASDALQAAVHIARNPLANVSNLFGLSTANAPFQNPAPLSAAPHDWTLAIVSTGNSLVQANWLAIDADGAVWVANPNGGGANGSVAKFLNSGEVASGSPFVVSGMVAPKLVAVDGGNHPWVVDSTSNRGHGSFFQLASAGSLASGPYTASVQGPGRMAIDPSGNVWGYNSNASLVKLSSASSFTSSSFDISAAVSGDTIGGFALDGAGRVWLSLYTSGHVLAYDGNGNALSVNPISGGGLGTPTALAIDAGGGIWVADQGSDSSINGGRGALTHLNSAGAIVAGSPFGPAGMNGALQNSVAVDGDGRVWVANADGTVSVANADGTPAAAGALALDAAIGQPSGIAIDSAGAVWVLNSSGSGKLTKLVGLATPVKTPLIGDAALP